MQEHPFKWLGYLFYFTFLLVACSGGTEITQKKVDEAYKREPLSNILVIAITGNEHNRRSYENKFVTRLKSVGVTAVASEKAIPMPADLKLQKEPILNAVHQYGNDAVIITQLVSKETKDIRTRAGSRGNFFFYTSDPGYSSTSTTLQLETNLYDAKTGGLIWSGRSNTLSNETTDKIMNEVIKAVVDKLRENKVIAPK